MFNIQSNMLRGSYMRDIVDRTVKEIHDDVVTVFGPFATDAYLNKDGHPYYTRDGKETVQSMTFDNELSMYILKMIFQAISDQAEKVGDGTTTLAVLYTNLYKTFRKYARAGIENIDEHLDNPLPTREDWNKLIGRINQEIKDMSSPLSEQDILQMLYTCTQDEELAAKIFINLKDPILNQAYIVVNKADSDTEFTMTNHTNPIFKATRQFSAFPIKTREDRCVILHCNGILDFAHEESFLNLMSYVACEENGNGSPIFHPKTIVILCNGTTEATRRSIKSLVQRLNAAKDNGVDLAGMNNVAIYTLDDYRGYSHDQIEDISTIITDEYGIGGLVNQLTFESLIYQVTHNPADPEIPDLKTFDSDAHHIDKMRSMLEGATYPVEFDDVEGIRIRKPLGPVAQKRYDDLRDQIAKEKSAVNRVTLTKRLRTMYGNFIDVAVGSRLRKDSQRKYELLLDAVLSARDGAEHGVLLANSLVVATHVCDRIITEYITAGVNDTQKACAQILGEALILTMNDMIKNGWNLTDAGNDYVFNKWIRTGDLSHFNLHQSKINEAFPMKEDVAKIKPIMHEVTVTNADNTETKTFTFEEKIIEPASIITTMLENSTLMLELATAKTFHVAGFMQNYIK